MYTVRLLTLTSGLMCENQWADPNLGSISAALSCLVYPLRKERLNAWAANHVCDVNSQLKFLGCFWWPQMSSDDNHWRAHMTPMARHIWTCAVFATSLLILVFQPIHTIVTEGHYMLCSVEKFFKESWAGLLTVVWQITCQRSHTCMCASCWHHVFVWLVQFAFFHLKI